MVAVGCLVLVLTSVCGGYSCFLSPDPLIAQVDARHRNSQFFDDDQTVIVKLNTVITHHEAQQLVKKLKSSV